MPRLKYISLTTDKVSEYRNGQLDSNNQIPERLTSDGSGLPCRHCLTDINNGEACLLLGYRPFPRLNPYAETGPIFIHADECNRYLLNSAPPIIAHRQNILIRGYDKDNRIVEGTGKVIKTGQIKTQAMKTLANESVKYLHVRSATNNCYLCRIELEN